MRTYPTSTSNKNVPAKVFLIAETSAMSGEIITTYYADRDCNMFKVIDWKGSKPQPVYLSEVCKLTGDSPNILFSRHQSYFRRL